MPKVEQTSSPQTAAPSASLGASAPSVPPRIPHDSLSVAAAAELVDKHEQTIRAWVKKGYVEATKVGARDLRIHRQSLLNYAQPAVPKAVRSERPQGGLYDPDWGIWTRDPFHESL